MTVPSSDKRPSGNGLRSFWSGRGEFVLALLMFSLCGLLLYGNATMTVVGEGGWLGPQGNGWLVAALAGALGVLFVLTAVAKDPQQRVDEAEANRDTNWTAVAIVVAALVAFTAMVEAVGWLIMATTLFATVATGLGNRNILRNATIGFILASVIQIVFSGLLGLALPPGILERG